MPPIAVVGDLSGDQQFVRKRRSPEEIEAKPTDIQPLPQSNQDDEQSLQRSTSRAKLASKGSKVMFDNQLEMKPKFLFHLPTPTPTNWIFLAILTVLAYATRLYQISRPNFVLWDEAHFGKFGSYYLRRMFYFDVHPPLGKMLVALGGWLAKVDGSFEFPSGQPYPDGFNYAAMRIFVAAFGTLAVPFTYLLAVQMGLGKNAAYLCGLMALLGRRNYSLYANLR